MDQEHSFDISGELYNRALNSLAGGVNSNVRLTETPHPLFYNKAKGSKIYDVDGNQYIDYVLGQGPMIFGHSPEFLLQAVEEASKLGQLFAGQHLLELEAAEAVKKLVPNAELVRFASSGTEAVEAAFRLARAYTKRNVIIKFEGHYHGWSDGVLFNTAAPLRTLGDNMLPQPEPMSQGVADNSESGLIILPWNNFEAIKTVFEERGDEIAAVITEPIMCNTNCIMPKPGYLEHLSDKEIQTNKKLNALGQRLMKGLQDINSRLEAGMLIQGPGSVFAVSFTDGKEVFDYRSHVENSDPDRYAVFVSEMMKKGIRINSRGIWFLSESHTDMDIESTLSAASKVLQSMAL